MSADHRVDVRTDGSLVNILVEDDNVAVLVSYDSREVESHETVPNAVLEAAREAEHCAQATDMIRRSQLAADGGGRS